MMTMLSFRTDEEQVAGATRWAATLGIDRSELLREALRRHLRKLEADQDVLIYEETPLTEDESALEEIAHWHPNEDWSDWADATG